MRKNTYNSHAPLIIIEILKNTARFSIYLFPVFLLILPYFGVDKPWKNLWPMKYTFWYLIILFIIFTLWIIKKCDFRIEITDENIRYIKYNKIQANYTLDLRYNPKVEKHFSQHGLFTGTSRFIEIINDNGRIEYINCFCMNKDDFAHMMACLKEMQENYIAKKSENISIHKNRIYELKIFLIPKEEFFYGNKSFMIQFIISMAIISSVIHGLWYFFVYDPTVRGMATPLNTATFIFSIFLFFPTIIQIIVRKAHMKRLPERIVLDYGKLRFDNKQIFAAEIIQIEMTPPNYVRTKNNTSVRRRIKILCENENLEYKIGNTEQKIGKYQLHKFVYYEYHKLCFHMEDWCKENKVKFILQYE